MHVPWNQPFSYDMGKRNSNWLSFSFFFFQRCRTKEFELPTLFQYSIFGFRRQVNGIRTSIFVFRIFVFRYPLVSENGIGTSLPFPRFHVVRPWKRFSRSETMPTFKGLWFAKCEQILSSYGYHGIKITFWCNQSITYYRDVGIAWVDMAPSLNSI